jgi:hypothetical protein
MDVAGGAVGVECRVEAGARGSAQEAELAPGRTRFLLLLSGASVLFALVAGAGRLGPRSALLFTPLLALAIALHAWRARDAFLGRLLLFGLVVGVGELPADWYGVEGNRTLVYPAGEPQLWASPLYMPLSWAVMMVQLGVAADALTRRFGAPRAAVALAVLGGLNIPFYETLAFHAGWWHYRGTPLLLGITPHYVILAEVLLSAALPWVVSRVARVEAGPSGLVALVGLGLAQAAWLLVTGVLAYLLVG